MISIEFIITALMICLIPGTGVLFTISTALKQGHSAIVFAALGCTLGIVPHLLATIFGLAVLMHSSAVAFHTLKLIGVVYLFYLAWLTWRDTEQWDADSHAASESGIRLIIKALLLNLFNPKLTLFFLAFLPQFVHENAPYSALVQLLLLSAIFMALTFITFMLYGLMANTIRAGVLKSPRTQQILRRLFALSFVGLSVHLARQEA